MEKAGWKRQKEKRMLKAKKFRSIHKNGRAAHTKKYGKKRRWKRKRRVQKTEQKLN
jgi:hypothetical protein